MKVLIVDDEPTIRKVLEAKVTSWGYEAVTASDGDQAVEILRKPDAPQLVILDWQMPKMCGDEVCRRARADLGTHPLHIILVTAKRLSKEDMIAGLEAGADDYLRKPCDSDELRARLQAGERAVRRQNEAMTGLRNAVPAGGGTDSGVVVCRYCRRYRDERGEWCAESNPADMQKRGRILPALCPDCLEQQLTQITLDSL
ncbi:MAG: response regulator transcription factor [Verrucomicrobia bacterium]|nr:response regulator transcription factor [Verrucomicrobiota bacterium]